MNQKPVQNCEILRLDHYGRGITYINEKITFVENALPTEIVDIEITKESKKFIEAKTIKIKKESKDRIKPICPYYDQCGGCNLMHMNYSTQLEFKLHKIEQIMNKYAGYEGPIEQIISTNHFLNYRNKITLKVKNGELGLLSSKSHHLIPIEECAICDHKINKIISQLKECDLKQTNQIIIKTGETETMVILDKGNEKELKEKLKDVTSLIMDNQCIQGKEFILNKIGTKTFQISKEAFFQVNQYTTQKLYDLVLQKANLTNKETILDLYCGTGTIGIYLSNYVKKGFGIEINQQAILDAIQNKKRNYTKNFEFISGDVSKIINQVTERPDLIIVDPPRSGLDNTTIKALFKINSSKIIYVSCDPLTLARDLKALKDQYTIVFITPVDMFPNTYHVECVCVLNRR